jgi:hypothetical protein
MKKAKAEIGITTPGRLKTRLSIELPVWIGFALQKVAEKKGKTVSELIADSFEVFMKDVSSYEVRSWSMEFREKYKRWLDR